MNTEDIELPPLPKASKMYDIPGYDEEELKDYARAAITALEAKLFELRKWRQEYVGKLTIAEAALAEKNKEIEELRKVVKMARAVLARSLTAGYNVPGPTQADIEKAFWALDDALKSEMKAGR